MGRTVGIVEGGGAWGVWIVGGASLAAGSWLVGTLGMWNAIYYYVQATTRCTVGIFWYFYTRLLKILVFFVYKTKDTSYKTNTKTRAARPRLRPTPDLQDQDQDQFLLVWDRSCHKTEVSAHITDYWTMSLQVEPEKN